MNTVTYYSLKNLFFYALIMVKLKFFFIKKIKNLIKKTLMSFKVYNKITYEDLMIYI